MTIAMAFKAKDAVVVAADRQGTHPDGTTTDISKFFQISPKAIMAISSNDYGWTNDLVQRVRNAESSDPILKVKEATQAYDDDVFHRFSNKYPEFMDYAGVIGVYDKEPKIFDFGSRSTVRPEIETGYVLTGEARRSAEPFVRQATFFMLHAWSGDPKAYGENRTWKRFSPFLIAQFCALILMTLPSYESSVSHGINIFRIDKSGTHEYGLAELFPSIEGRNNMIASIAKSALKEISPKDIIALDKAFHFIPELIRPYLEGYAKLNEKWPGLSS